MYRNLINKILITLICGLGSLLIINALSGISKFQSFMAACGVTALLLTLRYTVIKKEMDELIYKYNIVLFSYHHKERTTEVVDSPKLNDMSSLPIIININWQCVNLEIDEFYALFDKYSLINILKIKGTGKSIYSFDYDKFFSLNDTRLRNKLLFEFLDRVKPFDIKGIAILSPGRADYARLFKYSTISSYFGEHKIIIESIFLNDIILPKGTKQLFSEIENSSNIAILQIVDENDNYIKMTYDYILNNHMKVVSITTLFSSSKNRFSQNNITEHVIIELNLPVISR